MDVKKPDPKKPIEKTAATTGKPAPAKAAPSKAPAAPTKGPAPKR
jgi:hypothetical protein